MSDPLILDNTNFTYLDILGSLSISAKNLTLVGTNVIATFAPPTSTTLFKAADLSVSVSEELLSEQDGQLLLKSKGSDYSPEAKKTSLDNL